MVNGLTMDGSWNPIGTGTEVASAAVSGTVVARERGHPPRRGSPRRLLLQHRRHHLHPPRPRLLLGNDWRFFMGYRFVLFHHATQALGNAVRSTRFEPATP